MARAAVPVTTQDNLKFYLIIQGILTLGHDWRRAPRSAWPPGSYQSMALTIDDVQRIAHLARIEISATEADATLAQLNDIFGMIERMSRVDTEGIEPMSHPLGGAQRLREDRVTESDAREENLKNAPQVQDGLFLVPRVIE